jgi:protein SCO1/2
LKNKGLKRFVLFFFLFGVPFLFIILFSLGTHDFKKLKFWGEHTFLPDGDTVYYKVKDFSLSSVNGRKLSLNDFENKIIIALVLSPGCPDTCAIQADKFKMLVYDELVKTRKKFPDVVILAHVRDYYSEAIPDITLLDSYFKTDTSLMHFVTGSENSLFDFVPAPGGMNLLRDEHQEILGRKGYHQYALLIDKERHVRGVYDLSHSQRIRTLMEELRILKREYPDNE